MLMKENGWEDLANWLGLDDEVIAINTLCNKDNQPAQCCRKRLVQIYCDHTGKPSQQVAEDMAWVLEKKMKNKNVAGKLRALKLNSGEL